MILVCVSNLEFQVMSICTILVGLYLFAKVLVFVGRFIEKRKVEQ